MYLMNPRTKSTQPLSKNKRKTKTKTKTNSLKQINKNIASGSFLEISYRKALKFRSSFITSKFLSPLQILILSLQLQISDSISSHSDSTHFQSYASQVRDQVISSSLICFLFILSSVLN